MVNPAMDPDISGPKRMTKEAIIKLCKKNKLYMTPYLNDVLYLHYQGFTDIEGLEEYTGLKSLWLECNAISELKGLECQKELRCLIIHNNLIKNIENLSQCTLLDTLNLSHNFITAIKNCGSAILPSLTNLNLSYNHLSSAASLAELSKCSTLSVLDISHNRISDILIVPILANMPELRVLILTGNPVINDIPNYRKTLINECKRLTYLDVRPVFDKDRACAVAWKNGGNEAERKEHRKWNRMEERKIKRCVLATMAFRRRDGQNIEEYKFSSSEDESDEDQDKMNAHIDLTANSKSKFEGYSKGESCNIEVSNSDYDKCSECASIDCKYQAIKIDNQHDDTYKSYHIGKTNNLPDDEEIAEEVTGVRDEISLKIINDPTIDFLFKASSEQCSTDLNLNDKSLNEKDHYNKYQSIKNLFSLTDSGDITIPSKENHIELVPIVQTPNLKNLITDNDNDKSITSPEVPELSVLNNQENKINTIEITDLNQELIEINTNIEYSSCESTSNESFLSAESGEISDVMLVTEITFPNEPDPTPKNNKIKIADKFKSKHNYIEELNRGNLCESNNDISTEANLFTDNKVNESCQEQENGDEEAEIHTNDEQLYNQSKPPKTIKESLTQFDNFIESRSHFIKNTTACLLCQEKSDSLSIYSENEQNYNDSQSNSSIDYATKTADYLRNKNYIIERLLGAKEKSIFSESCDEINMQYENMLCEREHAVSDLVEYVYSQKEKYFEQNTDVDLVSNEHLSTPYILTSSVPHTWKCELTSAPDKSRGSIFSNDTDDRNISSNYCDYKTDVTDINIEEKYYELHNDDINDGTKTSVDNKLGKPVITYYCANVEEMNENVDFSQDPNDNLKF